MDGTEKVVSVGIIRDADEGQDNGDEPEDTDGQDISGGETSAEDKTE